MAVRIVLGVAMTLVAAAIVGRRLTFLFTLVRSGQPAPGRTEGVGERIKAEVSDVLGQRKLLKWSAPGLAHFLTFWGFIVLGATIVESYGALFKRDFAIPVIGTDAWLGFLEDFFAVAVLAALAVFATIRFRQAPSRRGRASRFYKSHTAAAWVVLLMIFNVIWTLLLYRGAQINTGNFPYQDDGWWPFASRAVATVLEPLGTTANEALETIGILLQIGVVLGFLVLVVYSKHLHIIVAPINVLTSRRPDGLGPLLPMVSGGKPIDFEDPGEDDIFGRGAIEQTSWKGMLDFTTCTECGRCQSQCPAWNTGKPLSPKLVITDSRDHLFAKAPWILAGGEHADVDVLGSLSEAARTEAERPLVGPVDQGGVIDPDVLWS